MKTRILFFSFLVLALTLLSSCASSKPSEQIFKDSVPQRNLIDSTKKDSLLKGNPDLGQEAFLRYLYLLHLEESDLAFEFLRKAVEAEPSNRYLAFTLASELTERKLYNEALMVAEPAKKFPGKVSSAEYGILATLYLRTGNSDSAKVYFKKAIQENEEDYVKMYEYSLFLEWLQPVDTEELMRVYAMLLPRLNYMRPMFGRLAQLYLDNSKDSSFLVLLENAFNATKEQDFLLDKIRYYESKSEKDSCKAVLNRLYQALPTDSSVVFYYVSENLESGNPENAINALDEYVSEVGDSAKTLLVLFYKGVGFRMMQKLDSAKVYFSLLEKDSIYAGKANANLSLIARAENDTTKAIRYLEKADAYENGAFWRDRLFLYTAYQDDKRIDLFLDSLLASHKKLYEAQKADSSLTDSLKQENDYLNLLMFGAEINTGRGQKKLFDNPELSMTYYKVALDFVKLYLANVSDTLQLERALFLKATILERLGMDEEAFKEFREMLKKNPNDHYVMNYLGYSLIDRNKSKDEVREGIALVDSALKFEPQNSSYLDSKAWGLYRIGKYSEALDVLRKAVALDEKFLEEYDYWDHLGMILEALGDNELAKECFIKLGELQPKHPHAKFPKTKKP